jgi:hypothetical protein
LLPSIFRQGQFCFKQRIANFKFFFPEKGLNHSRILTAFKSSITSNCLIWNALKSSNFLPTKMLLLCLPDTNASRQEKKLVKQVRCAISIIAFTVVAWCQRHFEFQKISREFQNWPKISPSMYRSPPLKIPYMIVRNINFSAEE